MNRYGIPDEPHFDIPKQPVFIDTISLDEELQLARAEFWEDMAPINRAWAAYVPRATWSQPLPMQIFPPHLVAEWGLTTLQAQFLETLVWRGEIGMLEAAGLVHRQGFQTALELLDKESTLIDRFFQMAITARAMQEVA